MNIQPKFKLHKKTVLLMGSARSGTTWLAGLLASPFRYRLLFEPFHPGHVLGGELVADHYYDPNHIPIHVASFINNAFEDRINSDWIAQGSNRRLGMHRWRFWPVVRIIKLIRGNLLIPAIRQLYGRDLPIVVIMRHPGAVVASMLRVKFPWAFDLSTLVSQDAFAAKYAIPYSLLTSQALDPVSQITVRWLIENLYLFSEAQTLGVRMIFYEDLVADPINKIKDLCFQLGIDPCDQLEEKVHKLSSTTHPRSPLRASLPSTSSWRNSLQESDIQKVEKILDSVGFVYPRQ